MTDELRGTGSLWFDEDDNNSNNADSPSEGEASSSAEHTAQEDLPSEASASESEDEQPAARRPRAAMTKVIARPSAVERRLAGALFGLDSDDDDPDAEQDAHDYLPPPPLLAHLTSGLALYLRVRSPPARLPGAQVDGRENSQLFNIHLQDFPIHRAQFTGQHSDDLMVTSRRPFYFSLDLASGKQTRIAGIMGIKEKTFELFEASPSGQFVAIVGSTTRQVHLVAGKSKLLIKTLHHNRPGDNTAGHIGIDAANTSPVLFTLTDRGQVYRWDLTTLTCTGQFTDQGTLMASQITTSPCGRIVAVSSHEGIVNLYDCGRAPSLTLDMSVRPVKTFTNLTTTIDCLEFNADASLLVFGSSVKKAQLRVVNMATQTVYDNWPRNEKALPLSRLSAVNFSPNGGDMGIADDKGRALLYRLGHSAEY
ncbi:hypothetical protein H696_04268 [Fonticula alba]|uniref:Vacuolar import/degradation Vid27 C-terminal domain-containing protein n=1 Tax=Fonticula alba TaxID=691883 RepID=A0A058Z3K9_FONAL|nr:hypothetical protein H696_04268 [Fonticula alba]KCV68850.1 hypothetical protein H696_04268 [Fonticula alba]|eukprot:XP_009496421.1 hypothetical protein H696_04268 [Fonticula alba]